MTRPYLRFAISRGLLVGRNRSRQTNEYEDADRRFPWWFRQSAKLSQYGAVDADLSPTKCRRRVMDRARGRVVVRDIDARYKCATSERFNFFPNRSGSRPIGPTVCSEILLEGRPFSARERRLLTRICSPEGHDAEVDRVVPSIVQSGITAARAHKRQIRRLTTDSSPVSYEERLASYAFADTGEYRRAVQAFLARGERRR
jgi:hypothetical protein